MNTKKLRHIAHALTAFLCVLFLWTVSTIAYAAPPAADLEDKTSDLQNELSDLNSEAASLSSDIDSSITKLESVTKEMEKTKQDLADARADEDEQYEAMKARIKYMYENGDSNLLEILFTSRSMAEFLNNAEYITTISEYDRAMLQELHNLQAQIEKKELRLKEEQESLLSIKNDLNAKQAALSDKISSTSGDLNKYSAQLKKAKEAAKAAQAALDKKAAAKKTSKPKKNSSSSSKKPSGGGSSHKPSGNKPDNSENNSSSGNDGASTDDVTLFAGILQCEAGNYEGRLAVATVIMNRKESRSYPNTLRGVIYQSGQFSPTWNGALDRVLKRGPSSGAFDAARAALGGARHEKVRNCYQFRTATASNSHRGVVIAGNVFF